MFYRTVGEYLREHKLEMAHEALEASQEAMDADDDLEYDSEPVRFLACLVCHTVIPFEDSDPEPECCECGCDQFIDSQSADCTPQGWDKV